MQFMEDQAEKPFDPAYSLMRAVANVICGITFGEGEDTANPDLERLLKLNAAIIANADDNQLLAILDFFPWARYLPIKAYDRVIEPSFELQEIVRKFLRQREKNFDPSAPIKDFISSLLYAKQEAESESGEGRVIRLSEDYFVITIQDMFFAGYETTSTTLKWVIAFLVNNPKLQEDLQCQVDEVLAGRRPSLNDRPNLPLIQAMIIETLRVANVVPLAVPHFTLTDTTLCGYRVPKDTYVLANTGSIHLDPKCWKIPPSSIRTVILTRKANWSPTKATSTLLELDVGSAQAKPWLKLSCSCLFRGWFKSLLLLEIVVIRLKRWELSSSFLLLTRYVLLSDSKVYNEPDFCQMIILRLSQHNGIMKVTYYRSIFTTQSGTLAPITLTLNN